MDEAHVYRAMDLLVQADSTAQVQEAVFSAVADLLIALDSGPQARHMVRDRGEAHWEVSRRPLSYRASSYAPSPQHTVSTLDTGCWWIPLDRAGNVQRPASSHMPRSAQQFCLHYQCPRQDSNLRRTV